MVPKGMKILSFKTPIFSSGMPWKRAACAFTRALVLRRTRFLPEVRISVLLQKPVEKRCGFYNYLRESQLC